MLNVNNNKTRYGVVGKKKTRGEMTVIEMDLDFIRFTRDSLFHSPFGISFRW